MPRRLLGKFNYKTHESFGMELSSVQELLAGLENRVQAHYGSSSKLSKLSDKASRAIAALRFELDNQLAEDYPDGFDVNVYYPNDR